MPQDTSNNEGHPDQNLPLMKDRHEDFQLSEVDELLRYPDTSKIMSEPPILPKGGEVYLYRPPTPDKRVRDQYWWVNRGNNFHSKGQKRPTIMKTYFSLKDRSGGRKSDCLNGFRRHIYRLADARDEDAIIFIHYLGDEKLHQPKPHGNTKDWWYRDLSASSQDTAIKIPEVPVATTRCRQTEVVTRYTTNIGSNLDPISVDIRAQSKVPGAKPGACSSVSDKIRQTLDTNNRKRMNPGWNSNNKIETNKAVNNPQFLHNNSTPSAKMAKVTINSAQDGQQVPQLSRTGQRDVQPPIQTYLHQSITNTVVSRRLIRSTPVSSVGQQSRPQQPLGPTKQPVKPVSLIRNQNLSARTQEQRQQQIKMPHLGNSLPSVTKTRLPPTSSQVISHEALQPEPGNQNYISQNDRALNQGQDMPENSMPYGYNYILQDSQPPTIENSSENNTSCAENSVSDDSTLPLDYEKFFEEASRLPRMGCDVFVLVSYPGCKPAYWGTEKYVKKFENSEHLLPFSASSCLSIKMKGSTDKPNLLANNLDLSQPIQRQLDELDSSSLSPNHDFVIKEEVRENDEDEELVIVEDVVKQEHEDVQPLVSNRQRRIRVMNQTPNNSLAGMSSKGNYQYKKQLNATSQYSGTNSYDFSTGSNRRLHRNKERTRVLVYKDKTSGDVWEGSGGSPNSISERLSRIESMLSLPSGIVEPSEILIKIEPETEDYGDLNNLVYSEYG